jgi:hypothetical protein
LGFFVSRFPFCWPLGMAVSLGLRNEAFELTEANDARYPAE